MSDRNERLCLRPDYLCRTNPTAFDDRGFKDEWQDSVYRAAFEYAIHIEKARVVDYGCGSGFKLMKYFSHFNTTGYEIEPSLGYLRETYVGRDWRDGASVESFDGDVFICADVIEHLDDPIELLEKIAASRVGIVFLSTPSLEILADQGRSPRLGPPNNTSHFNEWTTTEFRRFVRRYLHIVEHTVCRADQSTQLIVARVRPS